MHDLRMSLWRQQGKQAAEYRQHPGIPACPHHRAYLVVTGDAIDFLEVFLESIAMQAGTLHDRDTVL